ncbi:MAG: UTP--glucose-1-phosphate uridylyltransferase GalU [Euryarchaeota archaeon]|nr:UTP--glucose-1-phosphate uridylyltransferase GalU [Euryarchaeota archaeon]
MKAVIPAAGFGTRFLPATKSQPKEMLPVVDKPAIQYVVEEAVESGIDDILIITGRGKRAIEDHFDRAGELEHHLRESGHPELLGALEAITELADRGHIHYVRQKEPLGLGNAIACARMHVGREPFAVLLGDDIIDAPRPCTRQLLDIFEKEGCSVIAVERVPRERLGSYGVVAVEPSDGPLHEVRGLVEKPAPARAPSDLAVMGRYVLTPAVFGCLDRTAPGKHGEVQLTDALELLRKRERIVAVEFEGRRYDIGKKLDWLKATVELALKRQEFGDELVTHLGGLLEGMGRRAGWRDGGKGGGQEGRKAGRQEGRKAERGGSGAGMRRGRGGGRR